MRNLVLAGAIGLVAATGLAAFSAHAQHDEELVLNTEGFLRAHPDLKNRSRGMNAYDAGRHDEALTYFRRAARYADKPSQAMVGEMLWNGEGGVRDPALAYAWMDLAAERGYPGFTIMRERYLAALDEAQRADAIARGEEVYAEYGDDVAQPRIANVLRRERRRVTGSRLGYVGFLQVTVPGPGGNPVTIDGAHFFHPKFWEPEL